MAAPVPPGGGARGPGGGPAPQPPPPPLPPPGPPGPVGLVGPAGPLGPTGPPTHQSCPASSIGSCYAGHRSWITSPRPRSSAAPT